jgi:hypothetical protein
VAARIERFRSMQEIFTVVEKGNVSDGLICRSFVARPTIILLAGCEECSGRPIGPDGEACSYCSTIRRRILFE